MQKMKVNTTLFNYMNALSVFYLVELVYHYAFIAAQATVQRHQRVLTHFLPEINNNGYLVRRDYAFFDHGSAGQFTRVYVGSEIDRA